MTRIDGCDRNHVNKSRDMRSWACCTDDVAANALDLTDAAPSTEDYSPLPQRSILLHTHQRPYHQIPSAHIELILQQESLYIIWSRCQNMRQIEQRLYQLQGSPTWRLHHNRQLSKLHRRAGAQIAAIEPPRRFRSIDLPKHATISACFAIAA